MDLFLQRSVIVRKVRFSSGERGSVFMNFTLTRWRSGWRWLKTVWANLNGAVAFYTCVPLPSKWPVEFRWAARWVPVVGGLLGGLLALVDWALLQVGLPVLLTSVLVVVLEIWVTGGLHLDGVMDTADGLAVPVWDESGTRRRLAAMADSRMGAFGGMAAIALLLIKVSALTAITNHRGLSLIAMTVWGRWGQQWAIARYPYLKKEGKGAFHQAALPSVWYVLPGLSGAGGISLALGALGWVAWPWVWQSVIGGVVLAMLTSAYFNRKLGGHTGDTYGAVVEWTEAFLLCVLTVG